MDTQIVIDPDACVGYGECVAEDAAAVELDEHGCARALVPLLPPRPGRAALCRLPGRCDLAQASGVDAEQMFVTSRRLPGLAARSG